MIHHGHVKPAHERAGVLAEALLAGDELVAVVAVFHLALLHVAREADVVVRREDQAGAFPLEPLPDRLDLALPGFLLGYEMVQTKDHQGVGVGKNSLIDRELVPCLVDALVNSHRVIGRLTHDLLESDRGAVE